jgi:hypothetical protein
MTTTFCLKPCSGFFCSECTQEAVEAIIDARKDIEAAPGYFYDMWTEPIDGLCQYRMACSESKGWYCCRPCSGDSLFCNSCLKYAIPRHYSATDADSFLPSEGACRRPVN